VVIGCFDQFCEALQGPTVVVMDKVIFEKDITIHMQTG
jgi:hypothetical protein